uniref:hypothetical protein n=1 Tax=Escherichia coli TaxID=562 RepID=UPI000A80E432
GSLSSQIKHSPGKPGRFTPKLNGVAGPAFQVIKDSLTLGLNALTLTDVTKNAAYGVEIESLVLEINAPAA